MSTILSLGNAPDQDIFTVVYSPSGIGMKTFKMPIKLAIRAVWNSAPTLIVSRDGRTGVTNDALVGITGGLIAYLSNNPTGGQFFWGMRQILNADDTLYINNSSSTVAVFLMERV